VRVDASHPLILDLKAKREQYLARGLHGEAHGVATSMTIALAYLNRARRAPNLQSGFAPLYDPEGKT
jgi:hypothetical protein